MYVCLGLGGSSVVRVSLPPRSSIHRSITLYQAGGNMAGAQWQHDIRAPRPPPDFKVRSLIDWWLYVGPGF